MPDDQLSVSSGEIISLTMNNGLSGMLRPLVNEIYLLTTYIAGTYYIHDRSVFDGLEAECELILRREPENKYDKYAILVLNSAEQKLGYVPKKDNKIIARLMDAGKQMKVMVKSIDKLSDPERPDVEIRIFMIDFWCFKL